MRRLRLALRAYPRRLRDAEGDVLLSLAQDLCDAGASPDREALGLVRGGLVARAGALARAPWDEALGHLAVPLAVGFAALIWGRAAEALTPAPPAWPGWGWALTLLAPLLALVGLLARRRWAAVTGALLLVALGIAQGNSRPATTLAWFSAELEWGVHGTGAAFVATGGYALSALGCAIPGALVLLAAAARLPHAGSRPSWTIPLAWAAAGALGVLLLDGRSVTISQFRLDDVSLLLVAYGAAVAGFCTVVVVGRARRDPGRLLAALLALATTAPVLGVLIIDSLPVPDAALMPLLLLAALTGGAGMLRAVTATAAR